MTILSPVSIHVDPNKRCLIVITSLRASEHNPDSDDSTRVLRKMIEFKRNTVNRKDQGYVIVQEI